MTRWKDVRAIYQIYPRSFYDKNGDGVGDIPGIIDKLDYLNSKKDSLGANAIWISPFFPSPMADFGYDVSNYRDIHPMFGTLADFKELLAEAHKRSIKVMVDFVPNHSSDEHPWFQESRSSRDNAKRDWYVWRDPKPDGSPPNNWLSVFGGSAWEFDSATGQYYLHSFLAKQPDLNWDNEEVRAEMTDTVDFWLSLGVDGIRVDVARWISKDPQFRDNPVNPDYKDDGTADPYHAYINKYNRFGANLFSYLRELTAVIEKHDDRIIIFEDYPDDSSSHIEQYSEFYRNTNPNVAAPFIFDGMFLPYDAQVFNEFIDSFQSEIGRDYRLFYCFGNHDQPRIASRFSRSQARAIALLQLTLPGIPVIYYGDEIGMVNGHIPADKVQDPFEKRVPGRGLGRDPQRTPMQWSAGEFAGFSSTTPWLPLADDFYAYNVETERSHGTSSSYFYLYKNLLDIRGEHEPLRTGEGYVHLDLGVDSPLVAYKYETGKSETLTIFANLSDKAVTIEISAGQEIVFSTHSDHVAYDNTLDLYPHEGVILRG